MPPRPAGVYDRLLVPRIENYGQNHDCTDFEAVVAYLRASYREYTRQKAGPFAVQVARAIEAVAARGGVHKEELTLQALERRHRERAAAGGSDGGDGSDGLDLDAGAAEDLGRPAPGGGMNRAVAALYGAGAAAAAGGDAPAGAPAGEPAGEPTAFASPEAVAAAAAAAAAGARRAPHSAPADAPADPTADAPSTSGRAAPRAKRAGPGGGAAAGKRPRAAGAGAPGGFAGAGAASSAAVAPAPVRYADLGGMEEVLHEVRELVERPLRHPEVYAWLGVEPPRGVLLHGPPGCGKTALAHAVANECGVPFLRVAAPELVSGMSGESEARVRALFAEAAAAAPCIVFIDEIDAIAPKRETAQREMERRIVAQLLTCLDDLSALAAPPARGAADAGAAPADAEAAEAAAAEAAAAAAGRHVVVLGATNRPDALDPALRRAGRFDREIALGVPSEAARARILAVLARRLRLDAGLDLAAVARRTPGFVGADLAALMKEAAALAVARAFAESDARAEGDAAMDGAEGGADGAPAPPPALGRRPPLSPAELRGLAISAADVEAAVGRVQPSLRREGFATAPDVTWADVGALEEVREELAFALARPIAEPELFEALGLRAATGVLLFGPPGCGKTLVARAAAAESGANFISIKGPELLDKYVGESERAVRRLFARARAAAPCILFFDEMDALAPRRGGDAGNAPAERLVNQLLAEMDGAEGRRGVYVVAATNRPDMIDPALLRPGRLDRVVYVPLPPAAARGAILRAAARATPLGGDVDLEALGASPRLAGFSGADLAALVREACVALLKEGPAAPAPPAVCARHFEAALARVQPSVSRADQRMYDAMRARLRRARGHLRPEAAPAGGAAEDGAGGGAGEDGGGAAGAAQDMEGSAGAPAAAADGEPMVQ
jgi:ribosome biogenesis ATPase